MHPRPEMHRTYYTQWQTRHRPLGTRKSSNLLTKSLGCWTSANLFLRKVKFKVLWIIAIVTVTKNWECNMPALTRSSRWVQVPANWQSVMTFFKKNIFVYRLNLIMKYIKGNSSFAVSSMNCVTIDKNWE